MPRVIEDAVGAFVPGSGSRSPARPTGPLAGLDFAVKDLFDVAGGADHLRQSRLGPHPSRRPRRTAPVVAGAAAGRRLAARQDQDGRTRLSA